MMNENVIKAYNELVEIRNGLRHAENQASIEGYMKRLDDCMVYLQTEDEYAGWAVSLREAVHRYNSKDQVITMDYIIVYAEKLAELIEVTSEPEPVETPFENMREEAKAVCEDIASTVQMGYQVTKEAIKSEGPQYVARARESFLGVTDKIKNGVRTWLSEDDGEDE